MKKRWFYFLIVLLAIVLVFVYIKQFKSNQTNQNDNIGFSGGVLYDSDTYAKTDNERFEVYGNQDEEQLSETTEQKDTTINQDGYGDSVNNGISNEDAEETVDSGVIKEITSLEDMVEPPVNGSDGVL